MALTSSDVVCKHFAGRGVQWHQARLAELGAAHGHYRSLEIEIFELEAARFTESKSRDAQQPEQAIIDPGQQCTAFVAVRHLARGAQ